MPIKTKKYGKKYSKKLVGRQKKTRKNRKSHGGYENYSKLLTPVRRSNFFNNNNIRMNNIPMNNNNNNNSMNGDDDSAGVIVQYMEDMVSELAKYKAYITQEYINASKNPNRQPIYTNDFDELSDEIQKKFYTRDSNYDYQLNEIDSPDDLIDYLKIIKYVYELFDANEVDYQLPVLDGLIGQGFSQILFQ